MMITRLKYKDHKIMNNLEINLSKNDGTGYKKIVFLGENGVGKTTILNDLFEFLNQGPLKFGEIEFINDFGEKMTIIQNERSYEFGFHNIKKGETIINNNSNINNNRTKIKNNNDDLRKHGVVYSKVQVDFKTDQISSAGTLDINNDEDIYDNFDFTRIKQLLVDLSAQDSEDFANMHLQGQKIAIEDFELKYSKLYTFRSAINNFFENIKFSKITTKRGKKDVIFEKNNKEVSIDDLSTGEKQIVFRGVYILKNISLHENGFVLIDEPEISMHPRWEDKILKYYSDLLFNNNRIGQLIIATHSERILSQALKDQDTLIIGIKQNNGVATYERYDSNFVLPYVSDAEINFKIFKVYTSDLHLQLFDYIQSNNNCASIKAVDDFIMNTTHYNASIHHQPTSYKNINYNTICTSIRNDLHHGNPNNVSEGQLKNSIDLMYKICGGSI